MSAKKKEKEKSPPGNNDKPLENQAPSKPKPDKSSDKAGTEQVKATTVVTAQDIKPLDPAKAGTGIQKPLPAEKKTRGPDKQPRKKRSDAKPEPEPEPENKPADVPADVVGSQPIDMMAAARVTTIAFVTTYDVVFCGWCPPNLSVRDKNLLIDVWVPIVFENDNKIPSWVPAALVTLGITADRIFGKFS